MYVPWLALGCASMQSNARNREAIESEGRQMHEQKLLLRPLHYKN